MDVGAQNMVVKKSPGKPQMFDIFAGVTRKTSCVKLRKKTPVKLLVPKMILTTSVNPSVVIQLIQAHSHDKDLSQSTHMRSRNARKNILRKYCVLTSKHIFAIELHLLEILCDEGAATFVATTFSGF